MTSTEAPLAQVHFMPEEFDDLPHRQSLQDFYDHLADLRVAHITRNNINPHPVSRLMVSRSLDEASLQAAKGVIAEVSYIDEARAARVMMAARDIGKPTLALMRTGRNNDFMDELRQLDTVRPVIYSRDNFAWLAMKVFLEARLFYRPVKGNI